MEMSIRIAGPVALLIAMFAANMPANAQSNDVQGLADTISRLERQLQTLERSVYRGAPPPASTSGTGRADTGAPPAAVSQLQLTTDALEEQLRRLTGQVEELDFQVRQMNQRMDRLVADVDFRLRELEQAGAPAGSAAAPRGATQPIAPSVPRAPGEVTVSGDPGASRIIGTLTESQLRAAGVEPATDAGSSGGEEAAAQVAATDPGALPPGTPRERYDHARQFLLRRDFEGAEAALAAFVGAHPEDALAGNAQYWLGETFYVRGDYATAARAFAEGFQRYPDSSKAPDNLLKLGMSLAQLDQSEDACITLKKLQIEYPDAPASIVQRADREIGRLRCP